LPSIGTMERRTQMSVSSPMIADRSCAVKDMLLPLALFVALHGAFIGAALTIYVR